MRYILTFTILFPGNKKSAQRVQIKIALSYERIGKNVTNILYDLRYSFFCETQFQINVRFKGIDVRGFCDLARLFKLRRWSVENAEFAIVGCFFF